MTNEKIIYLGPEEEMTNVRERLENTDAGKIILVIPPQTHLRSHVGWRLLHSRVRELKQDVLIISSDRQIRSVAKAAGFRIADSLESPSTDRPRPTNRTMRSDMSGKASQGSRRQGTNGSRASRSLQSSQRQMPASSDQSDSMFNSSENMIERPIPIIPLLLRLKTYHTILITTCHSKRFPPLPMIRKTRRVVKLIR